MEAKGMKEVLMATTNPGKVVEASSVLARYGIRVRQADVEIAEPKLLDLLETAQTKAMNAYAAVGKPVVVEDTGIFFEEFPQFPGTYTKFAAKTLGVQGLLKLLEGGKRGARFVTIAAYCDGSTPKLFEGTVGGRMLEKEQGTPAKGMFYDSIFSPEGFVKSYAELGAREKEETSHRAKAFAKLGEYLRERLE